MSDSILQFEKVTFGYRAGAPPTLQDISLTVPRGRITALLGANGAGKSTLLLLALGWLTPGSGRILLDGRPLAGLSRREMGRLMGLVPQREPMPFEYSALEYVLLGRTPYLAPLAQPGAGDYVLAQEALERVGMGAFAPRSVPRLSGGECQMVLIARALAQQPRLLLLDEPTSHLDLHNKARLVELLRSLEVQGVSMLMTTHEPDLASALASHIVLMDRGRIQYAGNSADALTAERLSSLYDLPVRVEQVAGRHIVLW
jgi:iron complex transport system ATP-binding protein